MIERVVRVRLLWNNGNLRTTKEIEDDMSAPDLELIIAGYRALAADDDDRLTKAVRRGMWGDKNGR